MIPVVWILALNALCIPAAVLLHRHWTRARPDRASLPAQGPAFLCTVAAFAGLWMIGSISGWLWGFPALFPVFHAIFLGAQCLAYLAFLCASESGRRYYLLEQLQNRPGLTAEELAARYPEHEIIERRLDRLRVWGVISREDNRYRLRKLSSYYYSRFYYLWGKCLGFRWFCREGAGETGLSPRPHAGAAMNRPRVFWWSFALLALLKVLLVGDLEIHGDPYDDHGYAISAAQYYWGVDARANWLFIRPPGFPIFGSAIMATGLPYRIGIEIFFLAGAAWLCAGLVRARIPEWVALLMFAAIVFHPWTLVLFNAYLTEPLYLSLHLFLFGGMIRVIFRDRLSLRDAALWVIGLSLAWLLLTRREGPLLYATFAVGVASRLAWARWGLVQPWPALARNALWFLIPLLLVQAVTVGVRAANHAKWGVFATNEQEAPGFSGLLNALYAIDAPDASHYAPVTRESLKMAIAASPRMRELEDGLLDLDNPHVALGERITGRDGELGPWMWWRLYDAVAHAGIYTSPQEADAWMREAAAELDAALRSGELPRRTLRLPFPFDPNIQYWLPSVPERCLDAVRRLLHEPIRYDWRDKEANLPERYRDVFDRAANRRRAHLENDYMHLAGHAIPVAGKADFITVETADGSVVAGAPIRETDPGMRGLIRAATGAGDRFPTSFYVRAPPVDARELYLAVWREERVIDRRALHELSPPYWSGYPDDSGLDLILIIDRWSNPAWDRTSSLRAHVSGWAFAPGFPLDHVSLENAAGQLLRTAPFSHDRPDLHDLFYDRSGHEPDHYLGFEIRTPTLDTGELFLDFWHEGRRLHRLSLSELQAPHWEDLEAGSAGVPFLYGLDRLDLPHETAGPALSRAGVRHAIHRHYRSALWGWAGAVFLIALLLSASAARQSAGALAGGLLPVIVVWALLALALLGRGIFYGLVEAIVVPGEARYVESAAPIASALVLLLALLPGRWIGRRVRLSGTRAPLRRRPTDS